MIRERSLSAFADYAETCQVIVHRKKQAINMQSCHMTLMNGCILHATCVDVSVALTRTGASSKATLRLETSA